MAAVQVSAVSWPPSMGHLGPFQDNNGNLWIVAFSAISQGYHVPTVFKSSDGGSTWATSYQSTTVPPINGYYSSMVLDAVFDLTNGVIIVLWGSTGSQIYLYKFTIASTTWNTNWTSGTPPGANTDVNVNRPIFLTLRSTGEFVVFYQGPTHSNMGSQYRSVYYARCSSAGVWSAGVEVDAGGANDFDCKGACLGVSDRVHMLFVNATSSNLSHRSLDNTNTMDTVQGSVASSTSGSIFSTIYYDAILAKLIIPRVTTYTDRVARATSAAVPSWTADSNNFTSGAGADEVASCPEAFIYEPTAAKLYAFYRDATKDDVYQNSAPASGTTWGTAIPVFDTIVDQYQSVADPATLSMSVRGVDNSSGARVGQTFQLTKDLTIPSIFLNVYKNGSPTDGIVCDICTDNSGQAGTVLATSNTVSATTVTTSRLWTKFVFASPPSLSASTTYWLVIRRTGAGDLNNYCAISGSVSGNVYANGSHYYSNYLSGSNWFVASTYDLAFRIPGEGHIVTRISTGLIFSDPPKIAGSLGAYQYVGLTTNQKSAQPYIFTHDVTNLVISTFALKGGSPTDNLVIEIQSDSGGVPSGNVLATVATIPGTSLVASPGSFFSYSVPISINAGTKFWIVIHRSGSLDNTNYYQIPYGSWAGNVAKQWLSSSWSDAGIDLNINVLPQTTAIGVVFNDSGVYFDKLVLEAPPTPIPPVTANEEFFALL